jgi:hypothetical protein
MTKWAPLPGVTQINYRKWPLCKPTKWTWLDIVMLPFGIVAIVIALGFMACQRTPVQSGMRG